MDIHYLKDCSFLESRCTLKNYLEGEVEDTNPSTGKEGIRYHNFITALFLRIFGKIKIERSESGEKIYLNKGSFIKWKKWKDSCKEQEEPVNNKLNDKNYRNKLNTANKGMEKINITYIKNM